MPKIDQPRSPITGEVLTSEALEIAAADHGIELASTSVGRMFDMGAEKLAAKKRQASLTRKAVEGDSIEIEYNGKKYNARPEHEGGYYVFDDEEIGNTLCFAYEDIANGQVGVYDSGDEAGIAKILKEGSLKRKAEMNIQEALFNCHVNDADERAKKDFISEFGQGAWDKELQPFIDDGIMSIFAEAPNEFTKWFVKKVHSYVNGKSDDGESLQGLGSLKRKASLQVGDKVLDPMGDEAEVIAVGTYSQLEKYDRSGAAADMLEMGEADESTELVAVKAPDGGTGVFIEGEGGVTKVAFIKRKADSGWEKTSYDPEPGDKVVFDNGKGREEGICTEPWGESSSRCTVKLDDGTEESVHVNDVIYVFTRTGSLKRTSGRKKSDEEMEADGWVKGTDSRFRPNEPIWYNQDTGEIKTRDDGNEKEGSLKRKAAKYMVTGTSEGVTRDEEIDTATNELFRGCENETDIKEAYEAFWGGTVKVLKVKPIQDETESFVEKGTYATKRRAMRRKASTHSQGEWNELKGGFKKYLKKGNMTEEEWNSLSEQKAKEIVDEYNDMMAD